MDPDLDRGHKPLFLMEFAGRCLITRARSKRKAASRYHEVLVLGTCDEFGGLKVTGEMEIIITDLWVMTKRHIGSCAPPS